VYFTVNVLVCKTLYHTGNARCSGPVGQWGGTDEGGTEVVMVAVSDTILASDGGGHYW